jgi:predicted phage tail protein
MDVWQTIGALPYEAVTNMLDLAAFVLITPELIGEKRLDLLTYWIRRIFGGENRTLLIVVSLFIAGRIARYLGVPGGVGHFLILAGIAVLIGGLFMLIHRFVTTTPSRQLMLVLGAMLFVSARLIGIYVAVEEAR